MSWNAYNAGLALATLRRHGSAREKYGCTEFDLDLVFPEYEIFWRTHVVPCTNRPVDINLRNGIAPELERLARLNYGVWLDLVKAFEKLRTVVQGDLGVDYAHCAECLRSSGDAMQKFTEIQFGAEAVGNRIGRRISVFPGNEWQAVFNPQRERAISYRNYLVHEGPPPVVIDHDQNPKAHYVLRQEHILRNNAPGWLDLTSRFRNARGDWDRFESVCENVHRETLLWLNAAYAKLNLAMNQFVGDVSYQGLRGWVPSAATESPSMPVQNSFIDASGVTGVQDFRSDPPDLSTS